MDNLSVWERKCQRKPNHPKICSRETDSVPPCHPPKVFLKTLKIEWPPKALEKMDRVSPCSPSRRFKFERPLKFFEQNRHSLVCVCVCVCNAAKIWPKFDRSSGPRMFEDDGGKCCLFFLKPFLGHIIFKLLVANRGKCFPFF